jgi:general stress protein 26
VIDRLWNPFIAAWYEEGKDDPKLCLLRFDATDAVGADPKQDFKDKVAAVSL